MADGKVGSAAFTVILEEEGDAAAWTHRGPPPLRHPLTPTKHMVAL